MACPDSMTGAYLTGKRMIRVPDERRKPGRGCLKITGARANNLKNVTAKIEFGTLTVVTGVSGSGKSSLVTDTIAPALTNAIHRSTRPVGPYKKIEGIECIDKVIDIDQSPIGRTPRSNLRPILACGMICVRYLQARRSRRRAATRRDVSPLT